MINQGKTLDLATALYHQLGSFAQDSITLAYLSARHDFNDYVLDILSSVCDEFQTIETATLSAFLDIFFAASDVSFVLEHLCTAVYLNERYIDDDEALLFESTWILTIRGQDQKVRLAYSEHPVFDETNGEYIMHSEYRIVTASNVYGNLLELIESL